MRPTKIQLQSNVELRPLSFDPFIKSKNDANETFVSRKNNPLMALTCNLVKTYAMCNPQFRYTPKFNPRRILTKPSEGISNDGYDNAQADFILYVNDSIGSIHGHIYRIIDLLGSGTFGQVVKTVNIETNQVVAIKVVKNKPAYFNQGLVEIQILEMLNYQYDRENKNHIVRLLDYFIFRNHLCLVFELLSVNLYELIKQNSFRGLSINLVRYFLNQILKSLIILSKANVIHCDLKPENILLENLTGPNIKVIDFGSACFERQTVYSYIQSRFYRSPEVLIGLKYTSCIDLWSLGCIGAELFLGLPLLPGVSEYHQLQLIIDMFGEIPKQYLDQGSKTSKFFNSIVAKDGLKWVLKPESQYRSETNIQIPSQKKYFKYKELDKIIENFGIKDSLSPEDREKEKALRIPFIHFLYCLLKIDPEERLTPEQARAHPFITGEKWTGSWTPPPKPPKQITLPRVIPWGIANNPQVARTNRLATSFPEVIGMNGFTVGSYPDKFNSLFPPSINYSNLPHYDTTPANEYHIMKHNGHHKPQFPHQVSVLPYAFSNLNIHQHPSKDDIRLPSDNHYFSSKYQSSLQPPNLNPNPNSNPANSPNGLQNNIAKTASPRKKRGYSFGSYAQYKNQNPSSQNHNHNHNNHNPQQIHLNPQHVSNNNNGTMNNNNNNTRNRRSHSNNSSQPNVNDHNSPSLYSQQQQQNFHQSHPHNHQYSHQYPQDTTPSFLTLETNSRSRKGSEENSPHNRRNSKTRRSGSSPRSRNSSIDKITSDSPVNDDELQFDMDPVETNSPSQHNGYQLPSDIFNRQNKSRNPTRNNEKGK